MVASKIWALGTTNDRVGDFYNFGGKDAFIAIYASINGMQSLYCSDVKLIIFRWRARVHSIWIILR